MTVNKCSQCQKTENLCVCSLITPQTTDLKVLILQHPQEPKEALSTGQLAHLALSNSTLRVGLSWPNLNKALGSPIPTAKASEWAVLYLGSGVQGAPKNQQGTVQFVSKKALPVSPPESLKGIVILDGTWSQAKTLWWRNSWLLKLNRMILLPETASLYGSLRREPRKECLSTIESLAETLVSLQERAETGTALKSLFTELLKRYRQQRRG